MISICCVKMTIACLYLLYETAIKLQMSQNIHAYLIVMITGKTSIPETGITIESRNVGSQI